MRPYIIFVAMAAVATAQDATVPQVPAWVHSTRDDPLHGTSFDVFRLKGRYLTPPSKINSTRNPEIVLRCSGGKFNDGYIFVAAVVDRGADGSPIEMRLDGKLSKESWGVSTDGLSVFMPPGIGLLKLLWGHWLPHKEGKGQLIRKEIYGVTEAFGSDIVIQFDMPEDQSAVLNACTDVRNGKRF